jgi:hypothetical protein
MSAAAETRNAVGQGRAGRKYRVPECPVCWAVNGGRHGEACPNTGRHPAEWVSMPPPGWSRAPRPAAP